MLRLVWVKIPCQLASEIARGSTDEKNLYSYVEIDFGLDRSLFSAMLTYAEFGLGTYLS